MGQEHRRFTKEFEEEAVRLVETSGRTQQAIAKDLGIGLSTLRRWLNRRREARIDAPVAIGGNAPAEDMASELKRLRRENEILREERDILKRATAFFAREGNR